MTDAEGQETAATDGSTITATRLLDLEELGVRLQIARLNARISYVKKLAQVIEDYCRHRDMEPIPLHTLYRMEQGRHNSSMDELLLLYCVLQPEGGIAYFAPMKDGACPPSGPGESK